MLKNYLLFNIALKPSTEVFRKLIKALLKVLRKGEGHFESNGWNFRIVRDFKNMTKTYGMGNW